jgi:hypothetical protein
VSPAELSELSDGSEYLTIIIIEANLLVDGGVVDKFCVSAEDAEVGVFYLECFLGLEVSVVEVDAEAVEVEDVSNLHIEGEVFPAVAPQHHLESILSGGVDDLELLGEVPVVFVAEDVGAVDHQSDGGEMSFLAFLVLFLCLLSQLSNALQMLTTLHLRINIAQFERGLRYKFSNTHTARLHNQPPLSFLKIIGGTPPGW